MKRAFTIVEILVVMAVIGILITLAVVGISAVQKSQRETLRLNDLRNLKIALQDFYTKYRNYPPDNSWLEVSPSSHLCVVDWTSVNGGNRGVDNTCTDGTTGDRYFNKIKINQQVLSVFNSTFSSGPVSTIVTGVGGDCLNPKTPDAWAIYYKTNLPGAYGAQTYSLYACTENGLTINYGELND